MKNQVTFTHILAIITAICIPLFIWGVNVETRFEKVIDNTEEIQSLKQDTKENQHTNQENFDKVLQKLQSIELKLKDKKDRE